MAFLKIKICNPQPYHTMNQQWSSVPGFCYNLGIIRLHVLSPPKCPGRQSGFLAVSLSGLAVLPVMDEATDTRMVWLSGVCLAFVCIFTCLCVCAYFATSANALNFMSRLSTCASACVCVQASVYLHAVLRSQAAADMPLALTVQMVNSFRKRQWAVAASPHRATTTTPTPVWTRVPLIVSRGGWQGVAVGVERRRGAPNVFSIDDRQPTHPTSLLWPSLVTSRPPTPLILLPFSILTLFVTPPAPLSSSSVFLTCSPRHQHHPRPAHAASLD